VIKYIHIFLKQKQDYKLIKNTVNHLLPSSAGYITVQVTLAKATTLSSF